MASTPTAVSRLAALRRLPWQDIRQDAAALLRSALFHLLGGTVLLAMLAALYVLKRALGLDLFPGMDMLPDAEIEDALSALFG